MKNGKRAGKYIFVLAIFCMVFLSGKMESEAASKVKKLSVGKTYTTGLTGSKKHQVKFTYTKDSEFSYDREILNLYVDGKLVKRIRECAYSWDVSLCRISSKRTLICVRDCSDNDYNDCLKILEYKNNQMTELADLASLTRNTYGETDKILTGWARGDLLKVSGKKLVIRWMDTGAATGMFYVDISYKISGDEISRVGNTYALKNTKMTWIKTKWTANRNITTYTAAGGKKKSFLIRRGEKVTGIKMTRKNGNLYFQVKNARGKKGWFQDSTYSKGKYFEEAAFAG